MVAVASVPQWGVDDRVVNLHHSREIVFPHPTLIKNRVEAVLQDLCVVEDVGDDVRRACSAVLAVVSITDEQIFADKALVEGWMNVVRLGLRDVADSQMVELLLEAVQAVVDDILQIVDEVDAEEGEAQHFAQFNHVGQDVIFDTPFGKELLLYFDWTASGRISPEVEKFLMEKVYPWMANTHTETAEAGRTMTGLYEQARQIVKNHVGANEDDVLLFAGQGMTGAVTKFQDILNLRKKPVSQGLLALRDSLPEDRRALVDELLPALMEVEKQQRPVVFVTRLEHHSNDISWRECDCEVVHVPNGQDGLPDLAALEILCEEYAGRSLIGAFTACSNVTGVITPYHQMAKIMHQNAGKCFVDFAASAPYTEINMHPDDPEKDLDGAYFSLHKFLGGPGSSGVLIFNRNLYDREIPTVPGGGTVTSTSPSHQSYIGQASVKQIQAREDGGTPPILQVMRAGAAITLKEKMGAENMKAREEYLINKAMDRLSTIPGLRIFHGENRERYGMISFEVDNVHYNLLAALLNDRFGIQVRGGCSCAGTLGHDLFGIDEDKSAEMIERIDAGDLSCKPGWLRLSLHPTMTNLELEFVLRAIEQTAAMAPQWSRDYQFDSSTAGWHFNGEVSHA